METQITEQRKGFANVQQQMKGQRATEEVEQKLVPLEKALQGFEELAEKPDIENVEEAIKKLRTAEVKVQELQVSLESNWDIWY